MPLIPELLHTNWEDQNDPSWISACARTGFEYGADAVKILYAHDDFDKVVKACPVPVIMAGGPKSRDLQEMVAEVIAAGGKGCAIGRNVYGSDDPAAVIKMLRETVHGK